MRRLRWISVLGLTVGLLSAAYAVDDDFWIDIKNNREQAVMRYLAQGLDPNISSREELPAVMWAIQNQAWRVYDLLVAHKQFDPNVTNAHNETPLMYLAILGEDQRAQELIDKGAQVRRLGWTPLHYAASKGHVSTAQLLLKQGALVNAQAPDGTTSLMMAARSGDKAMVNLLLQQGADPTVRSLNKLTAADWAEANKQTRIAAQLRDIEQRYDHSNPQRFTLGEDLEENATNSAVSAGNTKPAAARSSIGGGGSQYFNLERFE